MKMTSLRPSVLMLVAGLGLLLPALESHAQAPPLDVNARNFRKRVQVLGTIPYGTTTPTIVLRGVPRFRAFAFRGNTNDPVEVWVRSPDGDPVAWILNERFAVVAENDDANEGEQDALLQLSLPAPGTYYILFRDYDFAPASFTVSLQRGRAAPACPPPLRWDPAIGRCIGESSLTCGGLTGRGCPPGYQCQDDPRDRCDPRFGGRDCGGTCVPVPRGPGGPGGGTGGCDPSGAASCTQFQSWDARACRCVDNPSCGGWAGRPCAAGYQCVDDPRDACDPRAHGAHCNGLCVAGGTSPGGCDPSGASRCAAYQTWDLRGCACVDNPVCGGPSARPCPSGFQCVDDPRDYCDPRRHGASCGGVCVAAVPGRCDPSEASRCTTYQTWDQEACQCAENPGCGGFTGRPCPAGYQCVDDPRDDCDPRRGGADCGGVCVTQAPRRGGRCDPAGASSCAPYQTWDGQACRCVDNPACGQTVGRGCSAGYQCVDDPRDGCDPRSGRRDCVGICMPAATGGGCVQTQDCTYYQHWDVGACQCVDNQVCGRRGDPPCPGAARCFDDPRDGCDPRQGQVGCPGICL
jgi:hypothetical protein